MTLDYITIPALLFADKSLNNTQRHILALVISFNSNGLKMSNEGLAELFGIRADTISKSISSLNNQKYVKIQKPQSKYRIIYLGENSKVKNLLRGFDQSTLDEKPNINKVSKEINTNTDFTFVLRDKNLWQLPKVKFDEYKTTYPNLDVEVELKKASQWLNDNPAKRKTTSGMARFLNGWLSRVKPQQQKNKLQLFTPETEQAFLAANSKEITEAEANELLREVGL